MCCMRLAGNARPKIAKIQANQTLHDVWPSPALVHYICTFGGSVAPDGILPDAKFTLRPCLAFCYIGSVRPTVKHCSSGRQPNFAAWCQEWNYRTFAEGATYTRQGGHHVGHRLTFCSLLIYLWKRCRPGCRNALLVCCWEQMVAMRPVTS